MRRPPRRRGIALMDAILGGVILGIGLAVVLSVASRSIAMQAEGQRMMTASWLLDELLAMVLVEGPIDYPQLHSTSGHFEPPFDDFEFDVEIDDFGETKPFQVTATVQWPQGGQLRQVHAQTYIAPRRGNPIQPRTPLEPIDRFERYYEE